MARTVPLLNAAKILMMQSVENFKNFQILLAAGLPAIRPTSSRSMAPDFSHNKGNRVQFTKLKILSSVLLKRQKCR